MSSEQRTLNREELEIHQVLSPASGSQMDSGETNRQDALTKNDPPNLSLDELTTLIKNATALGIQEGLSKNPYITYKRIRKEKDIDHLPQLIPLVMSQ